MLSLKQEHTTVSAAASCSRRIPSGNQSLLAEEGSVWLVFGVISPVGHAASCGVWREARITPETAAPHSRNPGPHGAPRLGPKLHTQPPPLSRPLKITALLLVERGSLCSQVTAYRVHSPRKPHTDRPQRWSPGPAEQEKAREQV